MSYIFSKEGNKNYLPKFLNEVSVFPDILQHFSSIDWTKKILENPLYRPIPTYARVLKDDGEDSFFACTLNTRNTISHHLSMQLIDFKSPEKLARGSLKSLDAHGPVALDLKPPDLIELVQLGAGGLDGHTSVTHGGMCCALIDEIMGWCLVLHQNNLNYPSLGTFTADLKIKFRAPVPSNTVVLVRCWLVGREGRKWLLRAQIVNEAGQVLTEGEALWISPRDQSM